MAAGNDVTCVDQSAVIKVGFLGIPPELRLEIYEHYFAAFELDFTIHKKSDSPHLQPALVYTCKLIQNEALPVYKAHLEHQRAIFKKHADQKAQALKELYDQATDIFQESSLLRRWIKALAGRARRDAVFQEELERVASIRGGRGI